MTTNKIKKISKSCCLLQCKNVVREIEKKLASEGRKIAPILADIWNRDEKSFYVAAFSGIRVLNFKIISQHLDETVYETVNDFVKEVQSMLKGVADQFGFSSEVMLFSVDSLILCYTST